ncbi:beta-lactamase/transpeptidase-like protein [Atractiella rhizophila]|nr:beta-lactamase/transpeptidase-like protein [Atractiella rhizophila]
MGNLNDELCALLKSAVDEGLAPGLGAVALSHNGVFASSAAGVYSPTDHRPLTDESTFWLASCSKLPLALVALLVVEKYGFDMDSVEELAKLIPEFDPGRGKGAGAVFVCWEKDEGGKRQPILKKPEKGITLRQLLLHTGGFWVPFTWEVGADLKDANEPYLTLKKLDVPRAFEAGTQFLYGECSNWVAEFIERISASKGIHKNISELHKELLFDPLGISSDDLNFHITPSIKQRLVPSMAMQVNEDFSSPLKPQQSLIFSVMQPQYDTPDGSPPEGWKWETGAGLHGSLLAFSKILHSVLLHSRTPSGSSLLSPSLFEEARADGLKGAGIMLPSPPWEMSDSPAMSRFDKFLESEGEQEGLANGWCLLNGMVANDKTKYGLEKGTIGWGGLMNTYWFVDFELGVAAVVSAQFVPFSEREMMKFRDRFMSWVVEKKRENAEL